MGKRYIFFWIQTLIVIYLIGCVDSNAGKISTETQQANFATEKPSLTPGTISTQSPEYTPAYSSLPQISEENVENFGFLGVFDGGVNSLAISPNGNYLAATYNNEIGILWDISEVSNWNDIENAPREVFLSRGELSFSSNSKFLGTGGTVLEVPSMLTLQEIPGSWDLRRIEFSPHGNTFTLVDWSSMSFWDYDGSQWALEYKQDSPCVFNVEYSPDGSLIGESLYWCGGEDLNGEGVNIWSVSDHELLFSFPPPEHSHAAHFNLDPYAYVVFSPNNQFAATGTKDQPYVQIWSLETGELVADVNTTLDTEKGYFVPDVECVYFSQDSKVVAIAGHNAIMFKRIGDGKLINIEYINDNQSTYVTSCAASTDGKLIFIGDNSGEVSLWGIDTSLP